MQRTQKVNYPRLYVIIFIKLIFAAFSGEVLFQRDFNSVEFICFFDSQQNKTWLHKMVSDIWTPKDLWLLGESLFQDPSQSICRFTPNCWSVTVLEKCLGRKLNKLSSKHSQIPGPTLIWAKQSLQMVWLSSNDKWSHNIWVFLNTSAPD